VCRDGNHNAYVLGEAPGELSRHPTTRTPREAHYSPRDTQDCDIRTGARAQPRERFQRFGQTRGKLPHPPSNQKDPWPGDQQSISESGRRPSRGLSRRLNIGPRNGSSLAHEVGNDLAEPGKNNEGYRDPNAEAPPLPRTRQHGGGRPELRDGDEDFGEDECSGHVDCRPQRSDPGHAENEARPSANSDGVGAAVSAQSEQPSQRDDGDPQCSIGDRDASCQNDIGEEGGFSSLVEERRKHTGIEEQVDADCGQPGQPYSAGAHPETAAFGELCGAVHW